jgi:hypothetical protein
MYASSPITIRKAWEYETFLLNVRLPGSLDIASARRVPPNVEVMKTKMMLAVTGMMPALWNRCGKAIIAGPQQLFVINANDPMVLIVWIDVGSQAWGQLLV